MIPPSGYKSTEYPLRHHMFYSAGLSAVGATNNSTIFTLIRNYKTLNAPDTIDVNPSHANFLIEGGAVCQPMSIIDKLSLSLKFSWTEYADVDKASIHVQWTPIFFSFPEKLDAADDVSTTTVAAILGLLKDATEEDVTPLFNNTKFSTEGVSDRLQPLSTVNLTETIAIMNMDSAQTMEAVTHDVGVFHDALRYYTNRGALKACIGGTRNMTLDANHKYKSYYIKKFVPRAVRRIVPYSFFGILVRAAIPTEDDAPYVATVMTPSKAHVGVTAMINYDEWNTGFHQDMVG